VNDFLGKRVQALCGILGRHAYATSPQQLTLQELGSLVIAGGCAAGFVVQVEVPVVGSRRDAKLDCAWLAVDGTMVVAWEFDGRDVGRTHILGDPAKGKLGNKEKFARSAALLKMQALYSLRNGAPLPQQRGFTDALRPEVETVRDADLMTSEMLRVSIQARSLAAERGLVLLGQAD